MTSLNVSTKSLSGITRRKLAECIMNMDSFWAGRLHEVEFLGRLYPLDDLPSTDDRYETAAGDIWQHRINNEDWNDDWVFNDERFLSGCTDEVFLGFIAETIHPEVRSDLFDEPPKVVDEFNKILAPDGYQMRPKEYISGHAVYGWVQTRGYHDQTDSSRFSNKANVTERDVLSQHLRRIENGLASDPALAVSSCKELLESLFKLVLDQCGVEYSEASDDLPSLYKKVAKHLELDKDAVDGSKKGSQASYKVLGSLAGAVQGLGELRNAIGLGHGKSVPSMAFERHARLSFNSTVTLAEFILDTREYRMQTKSLNVRNIE